MSTKIKITYDTAKAEVKKLETVRNKMINIWTIDGVNVNPNTFRYLIDEIGIQYFQSVLDAVGSNSDVNEKSKRVFAL